jgi:alkylation response protein AidB-like acyl-CoA dehydrogenase
MNVITRPDPATKPDPITRARDLGPALESAAAKIEQTQRIGEPLLTQLHDSRLLRLLLPRSFGGEEVEPWVYMRAVEEVSRHDASVGWNLFVANSSALITPFMDPASAHAIYDDPRALISWGPPNAARAKAVPGGYRISGEWAFASGCRQATWMGAHAQVEEPDGSLRLNARGTPLTRTLLFPVGQAELIHRWNVMGLRGTASDAYTLSDLFVPEAFSATREEPESRREPGRLYAFTTQGLYAVGHTGVMLGTARAMLDAFVALAVKKTPRNLGRLADSAVVQSNVARIEANLGAARAYLVETLQDIWATAEAIPAIDLQARARVRLACAHAIHTATEVADFAYKEAGTSAIFIDTAFERRFRDIHTAAQQIQARGAHFEAVGRIMLGIIPDVFY